MGRAAITLAANNGAIGGGEVMLLALAEVLRELGREVAVVGPSAPGGVLDAAGDRGFDVVELPTARPDYVRALRRWDRRERGGVLWCNGLVPAVATTGRSHRIVHLHADIAPAHRLLARAARRGALATLVPSRNLANRVPGAIPMPNWTVDLGAVRPGLPNTPAVLGFLGRPSVLKGTVVLAEACARLADTGHAVRLLIAGESRFIEPAEQVRVQQSLSAVGDLVSQVGWVDPREFFSTIDVAVFPSIVAESFGLAAAEAMSARTPVIVSDAGALPEVVGPGHPWIARSSDPAHLAEVIRATLGAPAPERAAVVDAARIRWEQHYSPAAGRRRVARIIDALDV